MHGLATTQMSEVDEMVEANPKDKKPKFFRTPQAFRDWLEKHHACEDVLLVFAITFLSESRLLVGHQCQEGRDQIKTPRDVD
jgi:hypothetical protein